MPPQNEEPQKIKTRRRGSESFEQPSLFTSFMTGLGFYILMILGYINSLLFTPKIAKEMNREVSTPIATYLSTISMLRNDLVTLEFRLHVSDYCVLFI